MRVAVIGQGSIGTRHARIALALGHEVTVYDPSPAVEPPSQARVAESAAECLQGADAAIVATPSSHHVADARAAIELGVPVLVEKPLALDCAHAAELDLLARKRGTMLSVAMNMREHAGVRALSQMVAQDAIGSVLRASAWCGSWLPGWRAGEDYSRSYSAHSELGGGVLLDVAVHELDYLLWMTGPARSVTAFSRQVSELDTDVEDVAWIAMELASGGVAEVAVDYFDRSYTRGCRIVGSEGTLEWSWERETLTAHNASGESQSRGIPSDVTPTYQRQLERFLAAVRHETPAPTPAVEAQRVLAVLDAARTSSREGRRVTLAPPVTLRPAGLPDAGRLLAWRNDPDTRRWSRSSREIAPQEHAAWLRRTLAHPSTWLWVAESGGAPVAHVRVGPASGGMAEVHVVVAPDARAQGIGAAVLTQAAAAALAEPGVDTLCAHIRQAHTASLRAFVAAGFHPGAGAEDGFVRLERHSGIAEDG